MSAGALIIVTLRLLVPLAIPRWPLAGGVASMVVDALDVVLIELIGLGGFDDYYHTLDKVLDSYYLAIECAVSFRWDNPWAKWIAVALFPYRAIGVVLFEVTGARVMLFVFPNLFENWWLYCAATMQFWPQLAPRSWRSSAAILLILLVPKMAQEYLLHYAEAKPWDWTKDNLL